MSLEIGKLSIYFIGSRSPLSFQHLSGQPRMSLLTTCLSPPALVCNTKPMKEMADKSWI